LRFFGEPAPLCKPRAFAKRILALRKMYWIVYAKPPFGGSEQVLAYLARYAHRAAIANSRLVAVGEDDVAFSYKDYRRQESRRIMRLSPKEFIRRFPLHVLPDGFHRIRHYGLLAKGGRDKRLSPCRRLAADHLAQPKVAREDWSPVAIDAAFPCPDIGGLMRRIGVVQPARPGPFRYDTS
jgi:hypothetical protein